MLTHSGITDATQMDAARNLYSAVDARRIIGREHGFPLYLKSNTLMHRICRDAYGGLEVSSHEMILKHKDFEKDIETQESE